MQSLTLPSPWTALGWLATGFAADALLRRSVPGYVVVGLGYVVWRAATAEDA